MILTAQDVAQMLQFGLIAWLSAMAAYVLYAVVLRSGAFHEMLMDDTRRMVPERIATLFITLIVAGYFVLNGLNGDQIYDAASDSYWMPDIPESLLALLVGGKSIFIAGKLTRTQR